MDTDRPHRSSSIKNSGNISAISSSSTTTPTATTSELFICFTSRFSSSSSMKISSKSILSPGRAGEPSQTLLSSSLSRRLRSNGSMKGGQASPMFRTTTNGKKRGCAFENPEPTSPKVTCIGQVRVKTKKQGKKIRTRSKRIGEVSFKRLDRSSKIEAASSNQDCEQNNLNHQIGNHQQQDRLPQRNQRWVHLPVSICEALRAFGAEFNCFLPCRSSCMASEKEKGDKEAAAAAGSGNRGCCGSVNARWLVSVQEGDAKGRKIELVVGEEEDDNEEETEEISRRRSSRRHVFEEIEFRNEKFEGGNANVQEEEARVSICIPPKNALLLMRCRSDPVRMAALANKFLEAPVPIPKDDDDDDKDEEDEEQEEETEDGKTGGKNGNEEEEKRNSADKVAEDGEIVVKQDFVGKEDLICKHGSSNEASVEHLIQEIEAMSDVLEVGSGKENQNESTVQQGISAEQAEIGASQPILTQKMAPDGCLLEEIVDPGDLQSHENEDNKEVVQELEHCQEQEQKQEEQEHEQEAGFDDCIQVFQESSVSVEREQEPEAVGQDSKDQYEEQEPQPPEIVLVAELAAQESMQYRDTINKSRQEEVGEEEVLTHARPEADDPKTREGQLGLESNERESEPSLPDCLLLMMCEPKLSMEVSKETWVCSRDFIKWLPEHYSRPVNNMRGKAEGKKRTSIDRKPAPPAHIDVQQSPRSSCSYPGKPPARVPGTESMATVIGQRLVGARDYEPFVLTRCKSEPMRSAVKLASEACFWKNRKLEPHGPATLGVRTAGVGF